MKKRWAKSILSQSKISFFSIQSTPNLPPEHAKIKISRLRFCNCSSDPSSHDDLSGLNGSDLSIPSDSELSAPASIKDFSFLSSASLNSPPSSSPDHTDDDAVLISDIIGNCSGDFDDKTLKFLRQFRGRLNDSLVANVLKLLDKMPETGIRFFMWAGQQIGYRHSAGAYDALLDAVGFSRSRRIAENYLREIRGDDAEVLGKLLNVLIRKCCRHGFWNEALEELGRLKDFGYKPSRVTYNALVLVLLKADRLDSAFLVHREMSNAGFRLDEFTLGCFARSLCKARRWREALALIEKEEFEPNTVIYTKMISGLCDASLFEEAMSFLHRMRSYSFVPNIITYQTLLLGCLRKRQLGRCKRILNMMIMEGCSPPLNVFNSLIHAFVSSEDYAYASKLLKKMAGSGCLPGYVTYNILIGGICGNEKLPSPDVLGLAENAYVKMMEAGIVLNKVNVGHFVRCLCGVGKFEKAFVVIREMMSKGFIPDTSTYGKVIALLCQSWKVEMAFLLFEDMKKRQVVPDVFTYTTLIDSFCKVGLIQQARNLFTEMVKDGCAPNVVTYTALIHAYLKARKVSEANVLFESMIALGCVPNIVTYTALIDGHCKAGQVEKACQIYSRMRGSGNVPEVDVYFRCDEEGNVEPNVYTYGALVDGLCKAHKVNEARELLDAMSDSGCEPNNVVYDALIDGFCKNGKLDEAQEVFARMSERGYIPNVYTYSSLIDCLFKEKRLNLALKVLSKMLENSCSPNVVIYTEMIDGLCKVGKTDEAYKLLVMMEEKGCRPNVVTFTALIDGFGKVGKVDVCLELFRQMKEKGCAPNFITYRIVINHCCVAGLLDEAYELLEEMKLTYWPKHAPSYRNVIHGFNRQFLISHGLLEELSNYESVHLAPAYSILVGSYCKAGKLEMALELHKEICTNLSGGSAVAASTYSSLIEGLCLACKIHEAFEVYADMTRRGYIPDLGLFVCLVKGLIRMNQWEEALELSHGICYMNIHWCSREQAFGGS